MYLLSLVHSADSGTYQRLSFALGQSHVGCSITLNIKGSPRRTPLHTASNTLRLLIAFALLLAALAPSISSAQNGYAANAYAAHQAAYAQQQWAAYQ